MTRATRVRKPSAPGRARQIVHALIAEVGDLIVRHHYLVDAAVHLPEAKALRAIGVVPEVGDVQPIPDFLEHQARF